MSQTTPSDAIPLREWVPDVFDDTQPLASLPHDAEPWEPLTDREAFKFWRVVACAFIALVVAVGMSITW